MSQPQWFELWHQVTCYNRSPPQAEPQPRQRPAVLVELEHQQLRAQLALLWVLAAGTLGCPVLAAARHGSTSRPIVRQCVLC